MTTVSRAAPLALAMLAAGCASLPEGPSLLVLPGTNRSYDQFRADDAGCRRTARSQVEGTAQGGAAGLSATDSYYAVQQRYDYAYVQCMYAAGHQVPVHGTRLGTDPRSLAPATAAPATTAPATAAPAPASAAPAARPALPPGVPPPPPGRPPPPPPGVGSRPG